MTIVVPGGGGGGTGNQTGTGSPVGTVTPNATGALYTDQSTGNVWVALGATSASWTLGTALGGSGSSQTLVPSVSGSGKLVENLYDGAVGLKIYTIVLAAWDDAGQTLTFTHPFTGDAPGFLPTGAFGSTWVIPLPSETQFFLPTTVGQTGNAVSGVIWISGV